MSGRSVFSDDALNKIANVRFWLEEDFDTCIRQIVTDIGQWTRSPHATADAEEEEIRRHAFRNKGELLLKGEHGRRL